MSTPAENIFRLLCEEEYLDKSLNKVNLGKININSLFEKTVNHSLAGFLLEAISYYFEYLDGNDSNYITEDVFSEVLNHYNNILGTNIYPV